MRVDRNADIDLDENGLVVLNGKGMSVAEHWSRLLPHLIPLRLKPLVDNAKGPDIIACYRLGEGPFESKPLNDSLTVALKAHDSHTGNVVPLQSVSLEHYQKDLGATRSDWIIDETLP